MAPVYNGLENLEPLVDEVREALAAEGWRYEILLVDDGSTDGSGARIDELARRAPEVRAGRRAGGGLLRRPGARWRRRGGGRRVG